MPINFKIYKNDQFIEALTVAQDVIKIGKLKSSHLCLEDDAIARMHAVIEVSGPDVRVIDLGSSTGTVLRDQRVEKTAVLEPNDVLVFGPYRVEVEIVQTIVASPEQQPTRPSSAQLAPPMQGDTQIDASKQKAELEEIDWLLRQEGLTEGHVLERVRTLVGRYAACRLDLWKAQRGLMTASDMPWTTRQLLEAMGRRFARKLHDRLSHPRS